VCSVAPRSGIPSTQLFVPILVWCVGKFNKFLNKK